jgi:hypothetical protein
MDNYGKPLNWRLFAILGLVDVALGFGLIAAGLSGMIGPDGSIFALVGAALGFGGAVITLFSRHKLSQVEDRRGDLN